MSNQFPLEEVHISKIRPGDAVIHDGKEVTVSGADLKNDPLMGRSLFGDSYHAGHKKVQRVKFPTFYKGKQTS